VAEARFDGTVRVVVDVMEATRNLVLNSAELAINHAHVETPQGGRIEAEVSYNEPEQQATIMLAQQLDPLSGYLLHLDFAGTLNDQLHGFYRSTYRDEEGVEQVIATTQFEPADARRAFPCWDEPSFKATFAISLLVDDGLTALSNEAVASIETLDDGLQRITFHETMVMSTYLVAFVIGAFELTRPLDVDGVPLRIAAVPGRSHLTTFAEDAASHALRFLSRYFEIPYPGGKMDHVAIPDFAFGAMENLGCVTYRENALLADPAQASQLELQRIATVIAHETAHMWFGDLVTMKWWNGIWLNEAFATFMELTTTDAFNPEWQVWTAFGAGKSAALAIDSLRATRPVEYEVGRPEEAEAMFDVLTYQKGGAVLRMLEQYLGPAQFRKGISHYLATHSFGNTETSDLWNALETASGEPVTSMMDSWIGQRGHPMIFIESGPDDSTVTLRQQRFLYDGSAADERWAVPINIRALVGGVVQHHRLLLDDVTATFSFDGPVDWVVINDGAWGFYRVRYSAELWARLRDAGVGDVLDSLERLALVVDTWAAVVAGMADLKEWVSVVESIVGEDDPDVWAAVGAGFGFLALVADPAERELLSAFVRRTVGPSWSELGWNPTADESRRTATARARVLSTLGLAGDDAEVRTQTVERFRRFLEDRVSLAPDLVSSAARVVVADGAEGSWVTVRDQYSQASNPQDRIRYLFALTESGDPSILRRTLDMAITAEVRSQDAPFLIAQVMGQQEGTAIAWDWVERNWEQILARFPGSLVARIFEGITSAVDPELAAAIRRFCQTHEIPLAGPRLDQLLERMDINVAVAARLRGTLGESLAG
jgi:puromycin-sensitive aminopeptidase